MRVRALRNHNRGAGTRQSRPSAPPLGGGRFGGSAHDIGALRGSRRSAMLSTLAAARRSESRSERACIILVLGMQVLWRECTSLCTAVGSARTDGLLAPDFDRVALTIRSSAARLHPAVTRGLT